MQLLTSLPDHDRADAGAPAPPPCPVFGNGTALLLKIYLLIISAQRQRTMYVSNDTLCAILYRETTAGWQDAPRWRLISER